MGSEDLLGLRLMALAKQVPIGAYLGDIGSDHGLIPVYLAKNGLASSIIATDISRGSLLKAQTLVEKEGLKDLIHLRLGYGLNPIKKHEVDTILIAGMGGLLMSQILKAGRDVLDGISTLILQPMSGQEVLRQWLVKNGFAMVKEVLVKESGYIYEILVAEPGYQDVADEIQYEIGFKFIENRDPLFCEYIEEKIRKKKSIVKKLGKEVSPRATKRRKNLEEKIRVYKEAYRCFVQSDK